MMKIPFINLKAQYEILKEEIDEAIHEVIEQSAFSGGPFVEKFENEFKEYCGCRRAIGVASGTDALWLALMANGIGKNDEVITVPNTFFATVEAICLCGAVPILVDVDEKSYNIDIKQVKKAITKKTKAIIPVHLFGQMADMEPIMEIARQEDIVVIEDACQAHGAQYYGLSAGTIGDAGCFSFYPGKNLGAYGEAGAVITNNLELADKICALRDHGQKSKNNHEKVGWNCRMDGIQGAVLSVKLKYLPEWSEKRRRNAKLYNEILSGVEEVCCPIEGENMKHVYHIYPIRTKKRDQIKDTLLESGIQTGIHYPIPIHMQNGYYQNGSKKISYPITEKYATQLLSLPMYPELTSEQIEYIGHEIRNAIQLTKWNKT